MHYHHQTLTPVSISEVLERVYDTRTSFVFKSRWFHCHLCESFSATVLKRDGCVMRYDFYVTSNTTTFHVAFIYVQRVCINHIKTAIHMQIFQSRIRNWGRNCFFKVNASEVIIQIVKNVSAFERGSLKTRLLLPSVRVCFEKKMFSIII
jgi:hypothetical protein